MCMSGMSSWLWNPIAPIRATAKSMGLDDKLVGKLYAPLDPVSLVAGKQYEKEEKTAQKAQQANQDSWSRYYASKQQSNNISPFTVQQR